MSLSAKAFFGASVLIAGVSIGGVHLIQIKERETMFAGVLRDEARQQAKRQQRLREAEFEDQTRKRAFLEGVQAVSNPVAEAPRVVGQVPQSAEAVDWGCKTGMCEKP